MPFYLRKSINCGPLKFNLSKSGIGVSTGVKGFRVGSGPRGNYVHIGRSGVYYRKSFSGSHSRERKQHLEKREPRARNTNLSFDDFEFHEIDSSDISNMQESSAQDLLSEIKEKKKVIEFFPLAVTLTVATIFFCFSNLILLLFSIIIGITLCIYTKWQDQLKKTVVLLYDLDDDHQQIYEKLYEGFEILSNSERIIHVEAAAKVKDKKYHSGAAYTLQMDRIRISFGQPPGIKCNLDIPCLPVGRQKLYFLPDIVLIVEGNKVGAISYPDLNVAATQKRMIEEGGVPRDSKVVDHTWLRVNKDGSKDKRFKDNRQLPVALYAQLHFTSESGLNELIQLSNPNCLKFGDLINFYGAVIAELEEIQTLPDERSQKNSQSTQEQDPKQDAGDSIDETKVCTSCGKEIENDSIFCEFCQNKQPSYTSKERSLAASSKALRMSGILLTLAMIGILYAGVQNSLQNSLTLAEYVPTATNNTEIPLEQQDSDNILDLSNGEKAFTGKFDDRKASELLYGPFDESCGKFIRGGIELPENLRDYISTPFENNSGYTEPILSRGYKQQDEQMHVLVSSTVPSLEYSYHAAAPLISAAIFKKTNDKWILEREFPYLEVAGAWGKPAEISWTKVGPEIYVLKTEGGYTSTGGTAEYLHLTDLSTTIPKVILDVNQEYPSESQNVTSVELSIIKNGKDYWDLFEKSERKRYSFLDGLYKPVSLTEDNAHIVKFKNNKYQFSYEVPEGVFTEEVPYPGANDRNGPRISGQ